MKYRKHFRYEYISGDEAKWIYIYVCLFGFNNTEYTLHIVRWLRRVWTIFDFFFVLYILQYIRMYLCMLSAVEYVNVYACCLWIIQVWTVGMTAGWQQRFFMSKIIQYTEILKTLNFDSSKQEYLISILKSFFSSFLLLKW